MCELRLRMAGECNLLKRLGSAVLIMHMQLTMAAWHRLQKTRGLLSQLVSPLHKAAAGWQGEARRAVCCKACLAPGLPVASPGPRLRISDAALLNLLSSSILARRFAVPCWLWSVRLETDKL